MAKQADKPRREKGTGSVYYDETRDRWRGEVTIDGKRHRITERNETDAKRALRLLTARRDTGQAVESSTKTVAQAVEEFRRTLPNRTANGRPLAPATLDWYRYALDIITDEIGSIRLKRLTVSRVETMLDDLADRPGSASLSAASLTKLRGILRRVLQHQVKRRELSYNVANDAELPPQARREERRQALSPDGARRLLVALREPQIGKDGKPRTKRNGAMFGLMLRLGLRPGEAGALYWSDLTKPTDGSALLNITRGLRSEGSKVVVSDELKTAASRRTIELPADLEDWLDEHRAAQVRQRLAANEWANDQLMFASVHGRPMVRKAVREKLARICKEHDIYVMPNTDDEEPRTPRPNELRHSCASLLADEGVPNELIADLLGHTTTRMVDQTYRHRLRPVVDVAARATWSHQA